MIPYDPDFRYTESSNGGRTTKAIIETVERCREYRCNGVVVFNAWYEAKHHRADFCGLLETGLSDRFAASKVHTEENGYSLRLMFPGFAVALRFLALSAYETMRGCRPNVITIDHHACDHGYMPHLREWVSIRNRFDLQLRKSRMN